MHLLGQRQRNAEALKVYERKKAFYAKKGESGSKRGVDLPMLISSTITNQSEKWGNRL